MYFKILVKGQKLKSVKSFGETLDLFSITTTTVEFRN